MRLGTETGSLVNYMMANRATQEITVGTPATFLSWTDRHPGTVIKVFEKGPYTYLHVRHDRVVYHEDESGNFDITDGDDARYAIFRFKTDGTSGFQRVMINPETNRYNQVHAGGLTLGIREHYYDPHF